MLRSGNQTAQASVQPSHAPAHESVSSSKASSATEATSQLVTAERNSPKPADAAPESNSVSNSVDSDSSGPDVTGLRIGMTPDQTRPIIKSRVLISDSLQKSYTEKMAALGFNVPAQGVSGAVPNGKYLNALTVDGGSDVITRHQLAVVFAPVPGHEEIVSVRREVVFPADKKPNYDVFEKTLTEKYGTPTLSYPPRLF